MLLDRVRLWWVISNTITTLNRRNFSCHEPQIHSSFLPTARSLAGKCTLALFLTALFVQCTAVGADLQTLFPTTGLSVVVDTEGAENAFRLADTTENLIYLHVKDPGQLHPRRQKVADKGFLGNRIYVEASPQNQFALADNLADRVWFPNGDMERFKPEAVRVLSPGGKIIVGSEAIWTKPFPEGMDDWTHPYHGPDNNPRSRDTVAQGPYLTQFLADPRYAPLPQVAVAARGRVFKAFGHIAFKKREEPWLNTLAAFNGYNGSLLWRREIQPGLMVHRNTLIADQDRLYYGDDQSCKILNAETGELVDEIVVRGEGDSETFWKWMALQRGVLYALVGEQEQRDPVIKLNRDKHGWPWNPLSPGFNQEEFPWGFGKVLVATDLKSKEVLWKHEETVPVDSRAICMNEGRLFLFSFGHYLTCLESVTGRVLWRGPLRAAPNSSKPWGTTLTARIGGLIGDPRPTSNAMNRPSTSPVLRFPVCWQSPPRPVRCCGDTLIIITSWFYLMTAFMV